MKKSLFITVSICFVLCLITARPLHAQATYNIGGTAGFETGLHQLVGNLTLDHVAHLGDLHPLGAVIDWGDNTFTEPGLLVCHGILNENPCDVYGTHWYASANTSKTYTVSITYDDPPSFPFIGNGPRHTIATTATISPPGDFIILSIGDSIASGEGNPVIPSNLSLLGQFNLPDEGFWDDPYSNDLTAYPPDEVQEWPGQNFPCHRSILAGPAQAAQEIQSTNPGVTFIHYACSGAKINAGDTPDTPTHAPQDAVGQFRVARGRLSRIDVLLISAGSNSLYGPNSFGNGFGGLVTYCLNFTNDCDANASVSSDLATSFKNLPAEYANLAKEINCINPADGTPEPSCKDPRKQIPKLVLITEYMDPTHDSNGQYPLPIVCPLPFSDVDQLEWQFFHDQVVVPLNNMVDAFPAFAAHAGLTVPTYNVRGIADAFRIGGICAGENRLVNDIQDSASLLGPKTPGPKTPFTNGTAHPNSAPGASALRLADPLLGPNCSPRCGQEIYRDFIYPAVVQHNPPETTPSATTDGSAYAFGTWTTHNVTVTLSAMNAIKESGVGATLYAVDNANCVASLPNLIPAGCLTYGGPFMITTSGKHTVTFFSQNANGYPEATQSVQVWVDNEPPVMTCTATPSVLWPPNDKMVPVTLNVTAVSAAFGPTPFSLKSVTTTESNAASDIAGFVIGQPSVAGFLRASRPGNAKAGESYTFVYQSSDPLGLTGTCAVTVTVPHDQRKSNP